jgi:hypothetical protein
VDAKGDLIAGSTADTVIRVPVGSNNQVLTADSSQTAGFRWASPASGGVSTTAVPIRFGIGTPAIGDSGTDRCDIATRTLTSARLRVASAPAGSAMTAEVQHWGGSSWVTIGTPSIAAGSVVENVATFSQVQTTNDLVRVHVTSVGSTTPAQGVVLDVHWS